MRLINMSIDNETKEKIEFAKRTHDGDAFYTYVLLPLFHRLKLKKKHKVD